MEQKKDENQSSEKKELPRKTEIQPSVERFGATVEPPAEQPFGPPATDKGHTCSICGSPNHHACGCEAREREKDSAMNYDKNNTDPIIDKIFQAGSMDGVQKAVIEMAIAAGGKFAEDMQSILDRLTDINTNLEVLVKMEQERADLLKDIQNGSKN